MCVDRNREKGSRTRHLSTCHFGAEELSVGSQEGDRIALRPARLRPGCIRGYSWPRDIDRLSDAPASAAARDGDASGLQRVSGSPEGVFLEHTSPGGLLMTLSNYAELAVLDHLFGISELAAPTTYLGASTADPGDDGAGLAEPVGGGYSRLLTAPADWSSASGGKVENLSTLTLPSPSGPWGNLTHVVAFDQPAAGNMLWSGELPSPFTAGVGSPLQFPIGDLHLTLAGNLSDYARNALANLLFNKSPFPMPDTWVAHSQADPLSSGAGLLEPVGLGYTRIQVLPAGWNAATGQPSLIDNAVLISIEATGDWLTISHVAIYDSGAGGNQLVQMPLNPALTINADTLEWDPGALDFTMV